MNWKTVGLTVVASLTLTACGNDNGFEAGQQGLNDGAQQTRFNSTTDYPADRYQFTGQNTRFGNDNNGANRGAYDGNELTRNGINNRNINNQGNNQYTGRNNTNFGTNTGTNNNTNFGANNQLNTNNNGNNNRNNYEVADEAAQKISRQVDEIDRAYVLTTDNNAYVAAELNRGNNNGTNQQNGGNGDNVSESIKREITDVVKSVNQNIDNVYVSTNPDFVNLSNNYVNDMNNGEPIEGFFDQFGEMIQRVFPQAR